jgi:hypothetical protein
MQTATTAYDLVHCRLPRILTKHAAERMSTRSLHTPAVTAAIAYGRVVHIRGAQIHAIGRREVGWCRRDGIDISRFEGVQVVCSADGTILTVYRNSDFSGLRPRGSRRRYRRRNW